MILSVCRHSGMQHSQLGRKMSVWCCSLEGWHNFLCGSLWWQRQHDSCIHDGNRTFRSKKKQMETEKEAKTIVLDFSFRRIFFFRELNLSGWSGSLTEYLPMFGSIFGWAFFFCFWVWVCEGSAVPVGTCVRQQKREREPAGLLLAGFTLPYT